MEDNITKLNTVVYILNHIETSGKQNLLNLGGAIDILEGIVAEMKEKTVAAEEKKS